ncbi:MAG TPA: type II secretion system protein [Phycisphaerales bacterium]|nr:type II secretion system protein [Phycisphaerales bacterium]
MARGFSLIELIVVMSVVCLLAGLLMPSLSALREQAHRMICSSNEKQLAWGVLSYSADWKEHLPVSVVLQEGRPQDLMLSRLGDDNGHDWDGIGLLYSLGYCGAPECYYCPSHHGDHRMEDHEQEWFSPEKKTIFTNYHYAGDVDWITGARRDANDGERLVLLTDGLRTQQDYNHEVGMNMALGDGSVRWKDDLLHLRNRLPMSSELGASEVDNYRFVWNEVYDIFSPSHDGESD